MIIQFAPLMLLIVILLALAYSLKGFLFSKDFFENDEVRDALMKKKERAYELERMRREMLEDEDE